jgi:DNA-binding MarR family transcriptional regulator
MPKSPSAPSDSRVLGEPSGPPARIGGRITWLLSRNHIRAATLLQEGFAADGSGLRSYHYRLLAALEEWGPRSQAELGRSTAVDRSDVVGVLGELEERGLVERSVDPSNRRRNIVSITPAGLRELKKLDVVIDEIQSCVLAPLTRDEGRQLGVLLQKLLGPD